MESPVLAYLLPTLLFLPFLVLLLFGPTGRHRRDRELAEINRRLRLIMDHLGIDDSPPALPEVARQIEAGNKIAAIKAYRAATGAGLAEAKRAVEEMTRR